MAFPPPPGDQLGGVADDLTEGGAADLLQRLARIYLGPDVIFPPAPYRDAPGYITRIRPDRFAGVGPWNPEQR